jgi:hypothetical protein
MLGRHGEAVNVRSVFGIRYSVFRVSGFGFRVPRFVFRSSLLLPLGLPLRQARELRKHPGAVPIDHVDDYIKRSLRRAGRIRRRPLWLIPVGSVQAVSARSAVRNRDAPSDRIGTLGLRP